MVDLVGLSGQRIQIMAGSVSAHADCTYRWDYNYERGSNWRGAGQAFNFTLMRFLLHF